MVSSGKCLGVQTLQAGRAHTGGMKRPFENYSAWCLAPRPATPAPQRDDDARERWDGEGGNTGPSAALRNFIRNYARDHARPHAP